MENFNDFCKLIDGELSKIAKKPELDVNSLHNLGELLDAKKDLLEILEKEQMLEGGQSMRYMPAPPIYEKSYRYGNGGGGGQSMGNEYYRNGGQSGNYPDQYGYQRMSQPQDDLMRPKMYN